MHVTQLDICSPFVISIRTHMLSLRTVYPQEKMAYDQGVWHTSCFKCLKCNSTLTLSAVAMIHGDLYCKVCFKKIFLKEGRYSSFSQVPGSQSLAQQSSNQSSNQSDIAAISEGTNEMSLNQSKNQSAVQSRTVSGTSTPREETKDEQSIDQPIKQSIKQSTPSITQPTTLADRTTLERLVYAIEQRDEQSINQSIDEAGVSILFTPYQNRKSLIEWCLSKSIYQSIGQSMIDRLKTEIESKNETAVAAE